jgi:hypothetical protein
LPPSSPDVKLPLSRARKAKWRVYPRSLDSDQTAHFSKRDVTAASPIDRLSVPIFLFPPLTKSVILCFFRGLEEVKAVGSEACVIAEIVHAIVDFDENKCREKQTGSGSGVLGPGCAASDSNVQNRSNVRDNGRR